MTDRENGTPFCGATAPGSVADTTQTRDNGSPAPLLGAGDQVLGARTGAAIVTPPHRGSRRDPPTCYEQQHNAKPTAHHGSTSTTAPTTRRTSDPSPATSFAATPSEPSPVSCPTTSTATTPLSHHANPDGVLLRPEHAAYNHARSLVN
ncbi:hypothetical protein V5P93_003986 [Actinokineospora auranticolor]|uniref:Uncharacterized protein n=1 Tax=Actinokineospora auranticolor TaxID=155976 RepID=A0A2S6GB30_9PSEU|nr:hypothetical protein [Actinokineospora auranticolor]PPK60678.1 hypothetical protein CLV40_1495 [Actinokineospora auranticolor]